MRHSTWQYLIDWTGVMARKHGGIVRDKNGKLWDWGQALCREMHGEDWTNDPDFIAFSAIPEEQPVPDEVLKRARAWKAGEWPDWAIQEEG